MHSNIVGGHLELGCHCGKTEQDHNLAADAIVGEHFEFGELGIHCDKTTISTLKQLMHSNFVGGHFELCMVRPQFLNLSNWCIQI